MENPLQSYYRHKDIYVRLPTGGKWLEHPPKLTDDGEIGVRAMSMKDELLLTIPDALYNGQAIFELVQSVCPDIVDPYELSLPDVDVILLASRASSYNKKFPVEARCPKCETSHMYDVDLQVVLGKVHLVAEQTEIEIEDLVVELRPNTLAAVNANNIKTGELAKMLGTMREGDDIDQSLKEQYSENMQQIAAANIVLIANAIVKVKMPNGQEVTDLQHIIDWIANSNRKTVNALQKAQTLMNVNGIPKQFTFQCATEDCGHEFETAVEFNPSFFFTDSSKLAVMQKQSISSSNNTKSEDLKSENNS
jgi:hypothetical protein